MLIEIYWNVKHLTEKIFIIYSLTNTLANEFKLKKRKINEDYYQTITCCPGDPGAGIFAVPIDYRF